MEDRLYIANTQQYAILSVVGEIGSRGTMHVTVSSEGTLMLRIRQPPTAQSVNPFGGRLTVADVQGNAVCTILVGVNGMWLLRGGLCLFYFVH